MSELSVWWQPLENITWCSYWEYQIFAGQLSAASCSTETLYCLVELEKSTINVEIGNHYSLRHVWQACVLYDKVHNVIWHMILDIRVMGNWQLSEQVIRWPVSHGHIAGSSEVLTTSKNAKESDPSNYFFRFWCSYQSFVFSTQTSKTSGSYETSNSSCTNSQPRSQGFSLLCGDKEGKSPGNEVDQFFTGKLPKIFDSSFIKTLDKDNGNTRLATRSTFYVPKIRTVANLIFDTMDLYYGMRLMRDLRF